MGLGAIGRLIARAVLTRSDLEIVAAIDLDAQRVGRKLSDVVDAPAPDVIVTPDADPPLVHPRNDARTRSLKATTFCWRSFGRIL